MNIKSLFTGIGAGADDPRIRSLPDFDQTQPTTPIIAQSGIVAERWNFEAVKFTGISDGPAFFGLNLQVVDIHFYHSTLTPP
jgi:hypothetical protein